MQESMDSWLLPITIIPRAGYAHFCDRTILIDTYARRAVQIKRDQLTNKI